MSKQKKILANFAESIIKNVPGSFIDDLVPGGRLNNEQALAVYRKGYQVRMVDSLKDSYFLIEWALGDRAFQEIALEFFKGNDSEVYNLSNYGEEFVSFLKGHEVNKEIPFIADLADINWQYTRLFHMQSETPISDDQIPLIAEIENPQLAFVSQQRLLKYSYKVADIWEASLESENLNKDKINDYNGEQHIIMYKQDEEIDIEPISEGLYCIIQSLQEGHGLLESIDTLEERGIELEEEEIQDSFELLFSAGLVKSFS